MVISFGIYFMYSYVLSNYSHQGLPEIALHSIPSRKATLGGIKRYAKELSNSYPEQIGLTNDMVTAAENSNSRQVVRSIYRQLIDLELYLKNTSY